ncbi:glycerophosphodiester phosphodiesterase [Hahella sp. SMD15-11]|uniref:Glycerophosphodiester phosphodiesterase n=1 Tax=Thermohahella caldifontis TaxID=3142973 RepID=A0AB39UZK6_9GAMM
MIIIGHRGAKGEAPENTLEGFLHAYENGIRHFELDVQISSDGELVVHHDSTLKRTANEKGRTYQHTAEMLGRMDARHNTPPWHMPTPIPTLRSILEALPDALSFQLEVKGTSRARMTAIQNALMMLLTPRERERCAVTSSHFNWIARLKHGDPGLKTGVVVEYAWEQPIERLRQTRADILVLNHHLCTPARVNSAHKMGREVSVWTVNDVYRAMALQNMGVDSLITDYPTHMQKAFAQHLPEPR